MGHRQAFEFSLFSPAGRLRPSLSGRNATIPRTFAVGQDARSTWATSIPRRSSRCECRRSSFTEEQIQRSRSLPAQETRKHRHRFAGNHRARLNVNGTTGTESFRYREKIAEFPLQPPLTGRLWSPLAGIDPQNCGTIWASAHEISTSRDWLAVDGVQNELPSKRTGTGSLCHAVVYGRILSGDGSL